MTNKKERVKNKPKCYKCDGEGIIYSKFDIGDFDLCDRCNGLGYLIDVPLTKDLPHDHDFK